MSPDNAQPRQYLSYLLRLWKTGSEENASWRASLEDPHTGERLTFTGLARLFAFLEDQCAQNEAGGKLKE